MSKQGFPFVALFLAGCFGSDPNMNSILLNPEAGTSGSGGSSGGSIDPAKPIQGMALATFTTNGEGFMLGSYDEPANLNGASSANKPVLSFSSIEGSPAGGSLQIVAPYQRAMQYADVQKTMNPMPQDWTGRTLRVRIKVASGTFTGGGAQLYVLTVMDQYVFGGTYINVAANNDWQEFSLVVDSPMMPNTGYDPSKVIGMGVQLNNGANGMAGNVTFNIDSFAIDPPLAGGGGAGTTGTAGTGGGGGTTGTGGSPADASAGN